MRLRKLLPQLKWFLPAAGGALGARFSAEAMEIDPWAVDLNIFHALIYARRAAGVAQCLES
jgi:hypothetical protein